MASKKSEPLKTGVIGVGLLGGSHARTAACNGDVTLAAVVANHLGSRDLGLCPTFRTHCSRWTL